MKKRQETLNSFSISSLRFRDFPSLLFIHSRFAPREAYNLAVSYPIPEVAPVMTTRIPPQSAPHQPNFLCMNFRYTGPNLGILSKISPHRS